MSSGGHCRAGIAGSAPWCPPTRDRVKAALPTRSLGGWESKCSGTRRASLSAVLSVMEAGRVLVL